MTYFYLREKKKSQLSLQYLHSDIWIYSNILYLQSWAEQKWDCFLRLLKWFEMHLKWKPREIT